MDSESEDQKQECIKCKTRTIPIYFINQGPLCAKHWVDVTTAYYEKHGGNPSDNLGKCIECQRWTPVIMFKGEGPYCVQHYLLIAKKQGDLDIRDENRESDPK